MVSTLFPCSLQGDMHTPGALQPVVDLTGKFTDKFLMFRTGNQVVHLVRILLQVVQFIGIPYSVISDEFKSVSAHSVHGRCLGIIILPVVLIENSVPPAFVLTPQKGNKRQSLHMGRFH